MPSCSMEKWKPVLGYEDLYEVSNLGNVRNLRTGAAKIATYDPKTKRNNLLLWRSNKCKNVRISTLVLSAFVGPRPEGLECCHNDGDALNNKLENLRWDTHTSNIHDRVLHGTSNRGERCGTAKLTKIQVAAIRADTRLQRIIAEEYGVLQSAISRIKSGVRWAHD